MNTIFGLITYASYLVMVIILGLALPFIADEMFQQHKAKNLAKTIAKAERVQQYDNDLLNILLRSERIDSKYMKFLLSKIIKYIHEDKSDRQEDIKFFQEQYKNFSSNEVYNDISQPLRTPLETLRSIVDDSDKAVLANLAYNIKLLEDKAGFNKKVNFSLTLISILVTLGSIYYSIWGK